jgi:hypothetical protein
MLPRKGPRLYPLDGGAHRASGGMYDQDGAGAPPDADLIQSVARTDREALRGSTDKAMKVVEHRFG